MRRNRSLGHTFSTLQHATFEPKKRGHEQEQEAQTIAYLIAVLDDVPKAEIMAQDATEDLKLDGVASRVVFVQVGFY